MHNHKSSSQRSLYIVAIITLSFTLIEAMTGWWSNSLALMSDEKNGAKAKNGVRSFRATY